MMMRADDAPLVVVAIGMLQNVSARLPGRGTWAVIASHRFADVGGLGRSAGTDQTEIDRICVSCWTRYPYPRYVLTWQEAKR